MAARLGMVMLVLAGVVLGGCVTTTGSSPAAGVVALDLPVMPVDFAGEPAWKVGDEWTYSDGYGLRVTEIKDGVTTFTRTDVDDQWIKRRGLLREESQDADAYRRVVFRSPWMNSPHPRELFPLREGKKLTFLREFTANQVLNRHLTSWEVLRQELIDVPAVPHPLKCWVLKWESISGNSDWKGEETWWYCPEIRNYARLEYRYGSGDAVLKSRTLMQYKLVQ